MAKKAEPKRKSGSGGSRDNAGRKPKIINKARITVDIDTDLKDFVLKRKLVISDFFYEAGLTRMRRMVAAEKKKEEAA